MLLCQFIAGRKNILLLQFVIGRKNNVILLWQLILGRKNVLLWQFIIRFLSVTIRFSDSRWGWLGKGRAGGARRVCCRPYLDHIRDNHENVPVSLACLRGNWSWSVYRRVGRLSSQTSNEFRFVSEQLLFSQKIARWPWPNYKGQGNIWNVKLKVGILSVSSYPTDLKQIRARSYVTVGLLSTVSTRRDHSKQPI